MPSFESVGKLPTGSVVGMVNGNKLAEVDWENERGWGDKGSVYDVVIRQAGGIESRAKLFVPEVEDPEKFVDMMLDSYSVSKAAGHQQVWEVAEKILLRNELRGIYCALLVSDHGEQWDIVKWH